MGNFMQQIMQLEKKDMDQVIQAIIRRSSELYPDWEIIYFALNKKQDREGQIEQLATFLKHFDKPKDMD